MIRCSFTKIKVTLVYCKFRRLEKHFIFIYFRLLLSKWFYSWCCCFQSTNRVVVVVSVSVTHCNVHCLWRSSVRFLTNTIFLSLFFSFFFSCSYAVHLVLVLSCQIPNFYRISPLSSFSFSHFHQFPSPSS